MNKKLISTLLVMATVTSTIGVTPITIKANAAEMETAKVIEEPEFTSNTSGSYYYQSLIYKVSGSVAEVIGTYETTNAVTIASKIKIDGKEYNVTSVTINNVPTLGSISIPEGVRKISLDGCSGITTLNLPESTTFISAKNCLGLASIILPQNVTDFCFSGCTSLASVKFPTNLSLIPDSAFRNCYALKQVKLPYNLALIGKTAFAHAGLTSISIPKNVNTINDGAFYDLPKLRTVKFNGNTSCVKESFDEMYSRVTKILVPEGWKGSIYRSGLNSDNIIYFTPKSIDEAATIAENFLSTKALNDTTELELINKINELIGDSENEVSFSQDEPFSKINATTDTAGSITGKIYIVNNNDKVEIPVNMIIDSLPITADEAADAIKLKLNYWGDIYNNTTAEDLIKSLGNGLNGITLVADSIIKEEPTTQQTGSLKFNILISDEDGNTTEVPAEITISKLPQTIQEATEKVNEALNILTKGFNDTTEQDILDSITAGITNSNICASFSKDNPFNKKKATSKEGGSITGSIIISDGETTQKVDVNLPIEKLPQTIEDAKETVKSTLIDNSKDINNNTTADDILNKIKGQIINPDINVSFDTEDPFNKVNATSKNYGRVSGTLEFKDSAGNVEKLPFDFTIDQLPQTIDDVKEVVEKIWESTTDTRPDNNMTEATILDYIRDKITNPDINVNFDPEDPFNKIDATSKEDGSITGSIVVTDGTTTQKIPLSIVLPKLSQSVDEAADAVKDSLDAAVSDNKFNNNTTAQDIIDAVKDGVTNPNITVGFDTNKPFTKVEATEEAEGSITGTIIVDDGTGNPLKQIEVSITLSKLNKDDSNSGSDNKEEEKDLDEIVKDAVNKATINNETTPEEVMDKIKDALGDGYNVKVDEEKPLLKEEATTDKAGSITGGIIITDKDGNEHKIDVNITIDKLVSGDLQAAVDAVKFAIQKRSYSNATTADMLLKIADDAIVDDNITVAFSDENPFNKVTATKSASGSITGDLVLTLTQKIETLKNEPVLDKEETSEDQVDSNLQSDSTTDANVEEEINKESDQSLEDAANDTLVKEDDSNVEDTEESGEESANDDTDNENVETRTETATIHLNLVINKLKSSSHHHSSSSSENSSNENEDKNSSTSSNNNAGNISTGSSLDDVVKDADTTKSDETVIENNEFAGKVTHYKSKASGNSAEKAHYIIVECDKTSTGKLDVDVKALDGGVKTIYCNNKVLDKLVTQNEVKADDVVSINVKAGNVYVIADSSAEIAGVNNNSWYQDGSKDWFFTNGENLKTGWLNDNGYMYNLGSDGKMQTGWINDNGVKKYLNTVSDGFKGAMKTGWTKIDGKWYYFNEDGSMRKGWFKDWTGWYYLNIDGSMATNTIVDGYTLGADGKLI